MELGDNNDPGFAVRATKIATVAIESNSTVVRRLTEMECERLQGYPDNWTDNQTASARYRQLGNSVAVPCVEWIARRLIAVDEAAQ
jgi:site-specific DNA-cytosine methylase